MMAKENLSLLAWSAGRRVVWALLVAVLLLLAAWGTV